MDLGRSGLLVRVRPVLLELRVVLAGQVERRQVRVLRVPLVLRVRLQGRLDLRLDRAGIIPCTRRSKQAWAIRRSR